MTARAARRRRMLLGVVVLLLLYGIASEIGSQTLPRKRWMRVHYVEDVELLPTYRSLGEEALFLVQSGILPAGLAVSTGRVIAGVLLGALVGTPLGVAMARRPALGALAEPWVVFFRFTPALALLPLAVLWFGLGEVAKVFLIAAAVGIVMLHGAFEGVRAVPAVYLDAAAALGARRRLVLRRVVLPASLPHLVTSFRVAVGLAWVTIVAAELIRPTMPSLGYLLALAGAYPRVPTIAVAIVTIGLLVLLSDAVVVTLYHRTTAWMRRHDDQ